MMSKAGLLRLGAGALIMLSLGGCYYYGPYYPGYPRGYWYHHPYYDWR